MDNVGQPILTSLLVKASNKQNDKQSDENLKKLDLNNDGKIAKEEIETALLDVNGDKRISSEDLGIYTAFICFSKNELKNNPNNPFSNIEFDINQDGDIDINEKALHEAFNQTALNLISSSGEIDREFIDFLENQVELLNNTINPNEDTQNRVIDVASGNVLSQSKKDEDGIVKNYSYTYYDGTDKIKTKTVENKETGIVSKYTYNKNG